jgi:hypothetical protein
MAQHLQRPIRQPHSQQLHRREQRNQARGHSMAITDTQIVLPSPRATQPRTIAAPKARLLLPQKVRPPANLSRLQAPPTPRTAQLFTTTWCTLHMKSSRTPLPSHILLLWGKMLLFHQRPNSLHQYIVLLQ